MKKAFCECGNYASFLCTIASPKLLNEFFLAQLWLAQRIFLYLNHFVTKKCESSINVNYKKKLGYKKMWKCKCKK